MPNFFLQVWVCMTGLRVKKKVIIKIECIVLAHKVQRLNQALKTRNWVGKDIFYVGFEYFEQMCSICKSVTITLM